MTPMSSALSLTLANWSDAAAISLPKAMQPLASQSSGLPPTTMILVGNSNSCLASSTAAIKGKLTAKALNSALFTDKGHFFLGPQRGDGHRDGAALHDAEIDGNGFRHVGQAEAHPVLGLDAHAF